MITAILFTKGKRQHLEYLVNGVFICPVYFGLKIHKACNLKVGKVIKGWTLEKMIRIESKDKFVLNKIMLYNCISIGKLLIGIKGIYLTPKSFMKALIKKGGQEIWEQQGQY